MLPCLDLTPGLPAAFGDATRCASVPARNRRLRPGAPESPGRGAEATGRAAGEFARPEHWRRWVPEAIARRNSFAGGMPPACPYVTLHIVRTRSAVSRS